MVSGRRVEAVAEPVADVGDVGGRDAIDGLRGPPLPQDLPIVHPGREQLRTRVATDRARLRVSVHRLERRRVQGGAVGVRAWHAVAQGCAARQAAVRAQRAASPGHPVRRQRHQAIAAAAARARADATCGGGEAGVGATSVGTSHACRHWGVRPQWRRKRRHHRAIGHVPCSRQRARAADHGGFGARRRSGRRRRQLRRRRDWGSDAAAGLLRLLQLLLCRRQLLSQLLLLLEQQLPRCEGVAGREMLRALCDQRIDHRRLRLYRRLGRKSGVLPLRRHQRGRCRALPVAACWAHGLDVR